MLIPLLLSIAYGELYYRFPCPRCGLAFSGHISGYVFRREVPCPPELRGKKCAHCGLPRGATSTGDPEGEAANWEPTAWARARVNDFAPKAKRLTLFSACVLALSVVLTGVTHMPAVVIPDGFVFAAIILTMIAFGAMCWSPRPPGLFRHLLHTVPLPVVLAGFGVLAYGVLNYFLMGALLEQGDPVNKDGKFFLRVKGANVRELTAEEYDRCIAYRNRSAFGITMILSVCPVVFFFWYPGRRAEEARGAED